MKARFMRVQPSSKGLVCDVPLLDGYLSGGFAAGATVQEGTNTYAATAVGTVNNIPIPVYPGFDFQAAQSHYIDIGAGPSSVKTVSLWVKEDDIAGNEYPIDLNGTDFISLASGVVTVNGFAGGTAILYVDSVVKASGAYTLTALRWHHLVVTDTLAKNASDLDIGRETANYYDGVISEVRLYSGVLTPVEVANIFNIQKQRYGR